MNLETGKTELIFSLADAAQIDHQGKSLADKWNCFVLAAFAHFEAKIAELEEQVKKLSTKTPKATPNNSSVPWTVKIQNRVSDALAEPYEELRSELSEQSQLFVDESPTKENKQKAWLWMAVAPLITVFGIFANRSRESLVSLVGNYQGIILNCDRAKMYLDGKRLQWCWSHLKRDLQKLIDSTDILQSEHFVRR